MGLKRRSDKEVLRAYSKAGSVWAAAKILGMCGQSVHDRLVKLGKNKKKNLWTADDDAILVSKYLTNKNSGTLAELARELGRTKHFICRQARRLGLTDIRSPKIWNRVWKGMTEDQARKHFEKFKRSRLGMGAYCAKNGFDDAAFSRTMTQFFPDEWDALIESKQPRQTMYRLGRHVEYTVRDLLRKLGYFVLRSPRSGSPTDLIAVKIGTTLFVQCKRSMALGVKEWNAFYDLALSVGAIPVLAGRPTGTGIVYTRLVGKKDGSKRRQPMVPFFP